MGYRLHAEQAVAHEVHRVAARQLELAIQGLTAASHAGHDGSVHDARRHIKKVRALTRLVRPALGGRYRDVNRRLRTVNRLLEPMADAHEAVATLTRVAQRDDDELSADVLQGIRAWLVRRESMAYENAALSDVFDTAAALLRAERDAVMGWRLSQTGFRAIAGGLERTARASRRALARAMTNSRSEDYHVWRQRAKDQWLHTRLLEGRCGDALALDERRLEALDGYLGECHNCAILSEILTTDSTLDRDHAARCLRALRGYERELRRCARRLGTAIYHETPKHYVRRVRRLWYSTRGTQRRGTPWRSAA